MCNYHARKIFLVPVKGKAAFRWDFGVYIKQFKCLGTTVEGVCVY